MTRDAFDAFTPPQRGRFGDSELASNSPTRAARSDLVDLELMQHAKTGKAILVSDGAADHKPLWLPLSQVEVVDTGRREHVWNDEWRQFADVVKVTLPAWLAKQKGLA